MNMKNQNKQSNKGVKTNMNKFKIIFYILDFIILILSYILCDYLTEKINLITGIIISLSLYTIVIFILRKILKIKN